MENRRRFIKKALVLSTASAASTSFISGCISYKYATYTIADNYLSVTQEQFLEEDQFLIVDYPQLKAPIFLHKKNNEDFEAKLMLCTHKSCDIKPAGTILVCPCHGSEFSRNGNVLKGPAEKPLRNFPVTILGDEIKIKIS